MSKTAEQMDTNILHYIDRQDVWGLGLDLESRTICLENNLLPHIKQIHDTIYETYRGVSFVEPKLIEDSEIPNYKICFEIHLTGRPVQILEDEEKFYALFLEKVPEEKQHFFTFTYRVF